MTNNKILGMVDIAHDLKKNYVVWEEVFVNGVKISNETVVEVWKGRSGTWKDTMSAVTKSGHKAILASPWYLNLISYGVDWEGYYSIEPTDFNGTNAQYELVMGGSAAMWGEYVDGTNILPRIWPRASAVGKTSFFFISEMTSYISGTTLERQISKFCPRSAMATERVALQDARQRSSS